METFGGIEAGGTKFVCVVTGADNQVLAETRFPTTTPKETLGRVIAFFKEQNAQMAKPVTAIGVACFGPIDPDPASLTFGNITTTPKPGWANTPVVHALREEFGVPVAIDTDVNAAAVGEGKWGAARGLDDFLYLTIGTGIGGGAVVNGKPLHGLLHPEMGHMRLPHDRARDPYEGFCPYHHDCFEGLAAGPAMQGRWGAPADTLAPDHPAWELEAYYIATALQSLVCILSPKRIILGGGVMQQRRRDAAAAPLPHDPQADPGFIERLRALASHFARNRQLHRRARFRQSRRCSRRHRPGPVVDRVTLF
jgi:fructokinase